MPGSILVVTYDTSLGRYLVQKAGSAQIVDGAITSGLLASGIVGTVHLRDLNVTSAKLAAAVIDSIEAAVADESITSAKLASGAVVGDRVAIDAIVSSHIGANVIGGIHILAGAIVSGKIGALAVGTPHIAALAIASGKVASGGLSPLSSGKIWAGYTGNIAREESKPTGAVTFLALTDTPGDYSGNVNKVVAVNVAENAVEFADPIPKTTDWKGSFNWDTSAYTTVEQDISALFSTNLALTTRRKYSVKLDLTNVGADASFVELYLAVKEKIDGTNYRAIDRKPILKADIAASAEPGIPIDIPATSENIQITMQMSVALAEDATIYYAVVKEPLE